MPNQYISENVSRDASFIIAASNGIIYLEAEVATDRIDQFIEDYGGWSGTDADWDELQQLGCVYDAGPEKWGLEGRIYFPLNDHLKSQMERYGYSVDDGGVRHSDTYRINNNVLFIQLIQAHHLILGQNN